ncbi:MAG TPA: hypothetical protein DC048_09960 [Planctomycetaceae bacterium]|nr:hypothetical protein [Planctomycetaceae bacterium]
MRVPAASASTAASTSLASISISSACALATLVRRQASIVRSIVPLPAVLSLVILLVMIGAS